MPKLLILLLYHLTKFQKEFLCKIHGVKVEEACMAQQEQNHGEIIFQIGQEAQILLILLVDSLLEPKQERFTIQLLLRIQEKLLSKKIGILYLEQELFGKMI